MRTIGQERSEFALNKVYEGRNIDKLKNFSAGAATVILQNGFGQAMAFWLSKADKKGTVDDKYGFIFNAIKTWLKKKSFIDQFDNNKDKEFISRLSTVSQREYLSAQKEAILLLEWIKRYASAFC